MSSNPMSASRLIVNGYIANSRLIAGDVKILYVGSSDQFALGSAEQKLSKCCIMFVLFRVLEKCWRKNGELE